MRGDQECVMLACYQYGVDVLLCLALNLQHGAFFTVFGCLKYLDVYTGTGK